MNHRKHVLTGILAAALALGTALPAMAKEQKPDGLLNRPASTQADATVKTTGTPYTSAKIVTPFTAAKPAGAVKQVTESGYTFMMPSVWQIPQNTSAKSVAGMLREVTEPGQAMSGVSFMTLESGAGDSLRDLEKGLADAVSWVGASSGLEKRYLAAPIGEVTELTLRSRQGGLDSLQRMYYPQDAAWCIVCITIGEDSAPTAEETAAYMLYTLKKAG